MAVRVITMPPTPVAMHRVGGVLDIVQAIVSPQYAVRANLQR